MRKVTPFLWYDTEAEVAVRLYTRLIENSGIDNIQENPDGSVFSLTFHLGDLHLAAVNAGPDFKFSEAFSLMIQCKDQAEIDRLWYALSDGGKEESMGWLKDRWGLFWQVVPEKLEQWLWRSTPEQSQRVMAVLQKQVKPIIADLETALDSE